MGTYRQPYMIPKRWVIIIKSDRNTAPRTKETIINKNNIKCINNQKRTDSRP